MPALAKFDPIYSRSGPDGVVRSRAKPWYGARLCYVQLLINSSQSIENIHNVIICGRSIPIVNNNDQAKIDGRRRNSSTKKQWRYSERTWSCVFILFFTSAICCESRSLVMIFCSGVLYCSLVMVVMLWVILERVE